MEPTRPPVGAIAELLPNLTLEKQFLMLVPLKRGIYGGAIGYIDFAGNMDTCIAIRLDYKKNDTVFVRSGAGIVADSDPEKEYMECLNKARASLRALELAQEVER